MRAKLYLVFGLAVLFLGPIEGLTQFQGGGWGGGGWQGGGGRQGSGAMGGGGGRRGGGGGGRGFNADPGAMFDRFANGKQVITKADVANNPWIGPRFDAWTQQLGVTNGQITRDQFVSLMQQRPGGGPGGGMTASSGSPGQGNGGGGGWNNPDVWATWAENMFRQLDLNGDGYLNNDEMPEALKAERDKWDTDKNGLIDLTEFKAYFQARIQQAMADRNAARGQGGFGGSPDLAILPAAVEEEDRKPVVYRAGKLPPGLPPWFQQLDTDQDGQIGLYEWRASGRPIDEFLKMDRNGDGFLTVEEVLHYQESQKKGGNGMAFGQRPGGGFGQGQGMGSAQWAGAAAFGQGQGPGGPRNNGQGGNGAGRNRRGNRGG